MNGYVYTLIDNVVIVTIPDVTGVGVGIDSLEGASSAAGGIDTTLARIFVTEAVLKEGDTIPDELENKAEQFIKKPDSALLAERLSDVEMIMASLLGA